MPTLLVNQVLRDEGLHPRKVVEQEDLTVLELLLLVGHSDAHPQQLAQLLKGAGAPVVGLLIEVDVIGHRGYRSGR